ncbi:MAG TPA: tryptophan synthase subunit alpha [Mycobacteriales bacterium]|nr:tryptophan synthase subunit alpha [Mycobacteriales bacterium]
MFARCRSEGRAALIGYLPVGFPSYDVSVAALAAMTAAGVDAVEVGMPYSDPLMDGPVIEAAVHQSLASGTRTRDTFTAVAAVAASGVPVLTMGYWNLVEAYGVGRFASDLKAAGGAGAITPDLLPEEAADWLAAATEHDLAPVFLVAPSSSDERIAAVGRANRGFIYAASTMGVTGERSAVGSSARELVARTRALTELPVAVGLGVSSGSQAAAVAEFADAVIVGSALVRALGTGGVEAVAVLTQELAAGVRGAE